MSSAISTRREGAVGAVCFTPPYVLDLATRTGLAAAFSDFTDDPAIRAIVVAGGAEVFVKGDVAMIADKSPSGFRALELDAYWRPILDCPKPVIAAVAGLAWGAGCELALMCDMIVADPSAQLAQPESRLGVMPGAGGMQRMVRTLGKQMTSYLLMTGDPVDAARAYQLGLVCKLAPPGEVEAVAIELATRLAAQPPRSLANIKRSLALGADLPLAAAVAMDHAEYLLMFDTEDQKEGMAAALAGRPPRFTGR
jgi:enoyl-CoA hydratase